MIGYIRGEVIGRSQEQIMLEVNGIGYDITVPENFPLGKKGKEMEIYTYTYVREDVLELFGFETREEKNLFQELLEVSGIGPKVALNIISTLSPQRLVSAVLNEEVSTLKEVSGIGPKSGQRLILELESRVENLVSSEELAIAARDEISREKELFSALNNLGYKDQEIRNALENIKLDSEQDLEEKIREVLNFLGKE